MRAILSTPSGSPIKFNGNTCKALAILDALRRSKAPLKVKEILAMTPDDGVLMTAKDEGAEVSGILQRLMAAGAVYHPDIPCNTRHYCLADNVRIEVTFT